MHFCCAAECHFCVGHIADHHHMRGEVSLQQGRHTLLDSLARNSVVRTFAPSPVVYVCPVAGDPFRRKVGVFPERLLYRLPFAAGAMEMALTKPGHTAGLPLLNQHTQFTTASSSTSMWSYCSYEKAETHQTEMPLAPHTRHLPPTHATCPPHTPLAPHTRHLPPTHATCPTHTPLAPHTHHKHTQFTTASRSEAETHQTEVPRMLLEDLTQLEDYVLKSKDRYIHTHIHPHTHTSTHTYIHTHVHPHTHTTHTYIHTHIHPHTHTSTHTYIHTHIHPHTHTSTHHQM